MNSTGQIDSAKLLKRFGTVDYVLLGLRLLDIKPENIFYTKYNELKLGDFGLAIDMSKDKPISR
eukprot:scaffold313779_cov18-Prasinocladus_malaysianus.AAC.1